MFTRIDTQLQKLAAHYLYKRTQPVYEELGMLVDRAIQSVKHLFPDIMEAHVPVLAYQVRYYGDKFSQIGFGYKDAYSHEDWNSERKYVARLIAHMLTQADYFNKSQINTTQRDGCADEIRDLATQITTRTDNNY